MSRGCLTGAASFTQRIPTMTRPRSGFNRSMADRRGSWPDLKMIGSSALTGRATANNWPVCVGCRRGMWSYSGFQVIKKRFTTEITKGEKTQKKEVLLCLLSLCAFCGESSFLICLLTQVKTAVIKDSR